MLTVEVGGELTEGAFAELHVGAVVVAEAE